MKKFLVFCLILAVVNRAGAQDLKTFHLYNPDDKASVKIAEAVAEAKAQHKHVLIQIGGNWCIWCARFNEAITTNSSIDSVVKANYVVYHLNYSKENKNEELLAKYEFPQRFGFPVFLILDDKGKLIHTQNSSYLKEGKGYNNEKIVGFFNDWTSKALDPAQYKSN